MRFIEFLINETVNVTIDPNDPAGSMDRAERALKMSTRDPSRAVRQRQQNLRDRQGAISKEDDPEIAKGEESIRRDEERVAKKRMVLAQQRKRKEQQSKAAAQRAGVR